MLSVVYLHASIDEKTSSRYIVHISVAKSLWLIWRLCPFLCLLRIDCLNDGYVRARSLESRLMWSLSKYLLMIG